MDFYFCETCGKRVTEKDLNDGRAQNKKLRGVYCSSCAIGVSTMDQLPLNDEQARELLKTSDTKMAPAKRTSSGNRKVGRRSTPGQGTQIRRGRSSGSHISKSPDLESKNPLPSSNKNVGIIIGSCAVVIVGLTAVMLTGSQEKPRTASVQRDRNSNLKLNARSPQKSTKVFYAESSKKHPAKSTAKKADPLSAPVSTTLEPTGRQGDAASAMKKASLVYEQDVDKALKKNAIQEAWEICTRWENASQAAASNAFNDRILLCRKRLTASAKASLQALRLKADAGELEEAKQGIEALQKTWSEELKLASGFSELLVVIKTKQNTRIALMATQAVEKWDAHFSTFDQAARVGDFKTIDKVVKTIRRDAGLGSLKEEALGMFEVAAVLARLIDSKKKAIKALQDGKVRTFELKNETLKGTVDECDGQSIRIAVQMEGVVFKKKVRFEDLTSACRDKFFGRFEPTNGHEGIVAVIRALAVNDLKAAEKFLAMTGNHPLAKRYRDVLELARFGIREAQARKVWRETLASYSGSTLDKAAALEAKASLESYASKYADTRFSKINASEIKNLERAIRKALGYAKTLTLDLKGGVKLSMVLIPAGTFLMGVTEQRPSILSAIPQHKVTLTRSYYMGTYEVTQPQYEQVMGVNPSTTKGKDFPVETLLWADAKAFCKKAQALTGRRVRLPTEAEWEYACRAGTTTERYRKKRNEIAWSGGNSGGRLHPVGTLAPNEFGLYDTLGNVSEYCQDWAATYSAGDVIDPQGPASEKKFCTRRGGGYLGMAGYDAAHFRRKHSVNTMDKTTGFRILVEVKD